jgi:hypothetical protein
MKRLYKKLIGAVGIVYVSHVLIHILFPMTFPHLILDILTLVPVLGIFVVDKYKQYKVKHDCNCSNCEL